MQVVGTNSQWKEWRLIEEFAQAVYKIPDSLAPGLELALQGCVGFSPLPTSQSSADFPLDLERTQIALGLAFDEGNTFLGKAQHLGLVLLYTSQQVAALGRLGTPTL